jgi:hypothetical protein
VAIDHMGISVKLNELMKIENLVKIAGAKTPVGG